MKADLYKVISKYTFYAIMVVTFVVLGMFFCVGFGNTEIINGEELTSPEHTDLLIYWMYVLIFAAIALVLVFSCISFFKKLKDSPMDAVKSMIGIILLVVIFVVAYAMSSDAPILINNELYKESSMLVMTDTFIYVQYVLLFVCALATLVSLTGVLKSVNKVKA